jgi:hypothetical protein
VATFTSATVKAGVLNSAGTGTASWNSSAIAGVIWNAAGTGTATFDSDVATGSRLMPRPTGYNLYWRLRAKRDTTTKLN